MIKLDSFLSQEEIDALLNQGPAPAQPNAEPEQLPPQAADALGEIGNMAMGSAATALSQILGQRVVITTPKVRTCTQSELYASFQVPYVVVQVNFTHGLTGINLFILETHDAMVIADLMMGGSGKDLEGPPNEIQLSAIGEAMNQMMGSAATAMSTIFNRAVKISPPEVQLVDFQSPDFTSPLNGEEAIVVVAFDLEVGSIIKSKLMQVMPIRVAREQTDLLLGGSQAQASGAASPEVAVGEEAITVGNLPEPANGGNSAGAHGGPQAATPKNLDLILDVPLKVSVVLGKSQRPIRDVLNLGPGSILELDKQADDPVQVLVNGTLIAEGEVVVINENFGVRLTSILSREERLCNLRR